MVGQQLNAKACAAFLLLAAVGLAVLQLIYVPSLLPARLASTGLETWATAALDTSVGQPEPGLRSDAARELAGNKDGIKPL